MRVAVLGTGIMGAPMARNLAAAGHEVVVWNRTREKAEATGLEVAGSPRQAIGAADAVLTMLPDAEVVGEVVALDAFADDAVWVQTSTVGLGVETLAARAEDAGVAFLDAPVLGTKAPAEQGALTVLAAGPRELRERCRPIFDAIGSKTLEFDRVGEASRFKLVLNSWILAVLEGIAETLAFAQASGFDPALVLETIAGGPLDAPYAQLKGRMMVERSFEPSFPLALAFKDTALMREAAARARVELPLVELVAAQFRRAIDAGHGDEDWAAVFHASAGG
jgi:3-hydroxyisobutyrate dehydrogenase